MNKIKFVMAAALLTATAACTQTGYDNSYAYNGGGYNNGYNQNSSGYWRNGVYYNNSNSYNSGYNSGYNNAGYANASMNPFYSPSAASAQRRPYADQDRDGVRNRNDSDANGDGIPDFIQR